MSKRIGKYLRQQHLALVTMFLVLCGGTALAVSAPKNSVKSKSVKNEALKSQDLKDGKAVSGADVIDDSLKGADVDEGSLNIDKVELPASLPPSGPAGGGLAGTYPNPVIAPNSVGSAQIDDFSVGSADLADGSVGTGKIIDGQVLGPDLGEIVTRSTSEVVSPGTSDFLEVGCLGAEVRLSGGGYFNDSLGPNKGLQASQPTGGNAWSVVGRNNTATNQTLNAEVLCLQG